MKPTGSHPKMPLLGHLRRGDRLSGSKPVILFEGLIAPHQTLFPFSVHSEAIGFSHRDAPP